MAQRDWVWPRYYEVDPHMTVVTGKELEVQAHQVNARFLEAVLVHHADVPGFGLDVGWNKNTKVVHHYKGWCETPAGRIPVMLGDYLVWEEESDDFYPVSEERFRQRFRRI